ncbi:MAG: hypothetical protein M1495_06550 [Bacteroidetes bacterium]|nr:hypothetical protein [Bacteroidota bacterium]
MEKLFEIAAAFYGVMIPARARRNFLRIVAQHLDERYSLETAIGLALHKLGLK